MVESEYPMPAIDELQLTPFIVPNPAINTQKDGRREGRALCSGQKRLVK
jgi:hypothetical protein